MSSGPRWLATIGLPAQERAQVGGRRAPGPGCGRSACRSAANTRSVPSRPSTLIAAAMSAVVEQRAQVGDRQHEHAEHAVGAVDQREALLLAQLDGLEAGLAQRLGRVDAARRRRRAPAPRPSAPARSARAARGRPSSRASRTRARRRDAGGEQRRVGRRPTTGRTPVRPVASVESRSSIIARTTSRSTSGPEPAAWLRIEAALQLRRAARAGCAASRARRSRSRRRSAASRVARERLDDVAARGDRGERLRGELDGRAVRARRRRRPRARAAPRPTEHDARGGQREHGHAAIAHPAGAPPSRPSDRLAVSVSETLAAWPTPPPPTHALGVLKLLGAPRRADAGGGDRARPRAPALDRLPPARACCATRASSCTCPRSAATGSASRAFELGSAYARQEPLRWIAAAVLEPAGRRARRTTATSPSCTAATCST